MEIYLIRHGETGGNLAKRHQADQTLLTPHGVAQAEEIAKTVQTLKPTHLISSRLVRAVETAKIIGEACSLVPETKECFIELRRPAYLLGHKHFSPRSLWYYFLWYFGLNKNDDGESYTMLRERFLEAKRELASLPEDARVVVVSHAVFIKLFSAHLCQEGILTPGQAAGVFLSLLRMPNVAVTTIHYDPAIPPAACPWSLHRKSPDPDTTPDVG